MSNYTLYQGDCIEVMRSLPAGSVHCAICSPPYWGLRSYLSQGHKDKHLELGSEQTPAEYVAKMVEVFREVHRLLRVDGTLWLNLGDSYANDGKHGGKAGKLHNYLDEENRLRVGRQKRTTGLPPKSLIGIPWRLAFALQDDGWILRQDIIWQKENPLPESVGDRCTRSHEYIFLLAKSPIYFYDAVAIKEPSVTNDYRRPYGSPGMWEMDGRPDDQRHGGEARTLKRSTRDSFKRNGSKREQPIPGQVYGTHRPDRPEDDWDIATRNKRDVWTVSSGSTSVDGHYATYPPELITPCVLAGTSAYGCCSACGAPWERVVEREAVLESGRKQPGYGTKTDGGGFQRNGHDGSTLHHNVTYATTGWQPTCTCNAGVISCTVLDCFAGASTTGIVAINHGRRFIGIDLNADYIEMGRKRLERTQPALLAAI